MKRLNQTLLMTLIAAVFYACSGGEAANDKVAELEALKSQRKELDAQIKTLEDELIESGQIKPAEVRKVLVTAFDLKPQAFEHRVELRGGVASKTDVVLSAETMGKIESIKVKEGQRVKKGQLLVTLEADILKNSISEVKTQLELATTIFERQAKLWDQNIGTEVQYLQSKNNKEALEGKLETLDAQLSQARVVAPFSGVVDNIPVKVGEMAQPGLPLVRIVNPDEMYITADVSESYLGKFQEGQLVNIYFPSQDKSITSKISSVGQVIKNENRTFEIEINLPAINFTVKPNQVVVIDMSDYNTEEALVVPTKIIQTDSKGSYVYELINEGENIIAKKVYVEPGVSYDLKTEILKGLTKGQVIANDGFRELAQGMAVSIQ